jgi:hypothetical protein
MVLAQFVGPLGELQPNFGQDFEARFQLYVVALAVVKRNGFHTLVFA